MNRRALPEPVFGAVDETDTESAAPLNVLEEQLKEIVVGVVNNDAFGITTDLRYVGLTSILAIKLATQIFKRFGVQLDAKLLTQGANIQTIENEILTAMLSGSATTTSSAPANTDSSDRRVFRQHEEPHFYTL